MGGGRWDKGVRDRQEWWEKGVVGGGTERRVGQDRRRK